MIKILIVEDERPIADLLDMSLTAAGYSCECLDNGAAAADAVEAKRYDLILLDVMLPGINGFELMEYLARWLYHHIISSDAMIGKLPKLEEWMVKENPCEFLDEYRTGIDFVDEEHKVLFQITDKAYKLLQRDFSLDGYDEVMDVITELKDYTVRHFNDEEAYMERIKYEGLAAQRRAHESFIQRIEGVDLDNVEGDLKEYLASLIEFLLGWLINHILYTDKKIPMN